MDYLLPLLVLVVVPIGFFGLARGRYAGFGFPQSLLRVLVALPLLFSGVVLHFMRAHDTLGMVPPGFPDPAFLVALSGLLEVLGGIGLFVPAWRRRAGFLLILLMIAVFPANVFVAGRVVGSMRMPSVPVRTAMQMVYMVLILLVSYGLPVRRRGKASSGIARSS